MKIQEKLQIIESFNLIIKEVYPDVFKVINSDKEINVHKLGTSLGSCVVLVKQAHMKKINGYGNTMGHVQYIKLGNGSNDRIYALWNQLEGEGVETVIDVYNSNAFNTDSVDTVYCEEEICRI